MGGWGMVGSSIQFGKTAWHDIGRVKTSLELVILRFKYLEDIHMELKVYRSPESITLEKKIEL